LWDCEIIERKNDDNCSMMDMKNSLPPLTPWTFCKTAFVLCCLALVSCTAGCLIVPIPHSRTWAPAREGLVINAKTGTPVANAQVSSLHEKGGSTRTDGKGHFRLPPAKSWHGAYMCAIPISFSLFPTLDMPHRTGQGVVVSAAGFETYDESHLPSIENEWWPPVLPATISLEPTDANR
jgi:hypothetical protein